MPNATITSTASTFGTITGTFAADQSTVTGTIAGTITGTLDGSVGVPGPAGPTGSQGPQGDPGEGVAAGGTTGQVLQKLSATNYDTGWLTLGTMATQTAANYALLASPAFTGNPTSVTPSIGDNDTSIATTAFVKAQGYFYAPTITWSSGAPEINDTVTDLSVLTTSANFLFSASTTSYVDDGSGVAIVSESGSFNLTKSGLSLYRYPVYNGQNPSSPTVGGELNYDSETAVLTLRAFTAAPTDNTITIAPTGVTLPNAGSITFGDATVQTTAATSFDPTGYALLASPVFTGNPTAPTPATNDNDTSIATTAYVKAQDFGDRYLTTSTTSNTINNANKTFTIGTGLSYTPTQNLTISYDASNHMHGEVLTYNSGTGVLTVDINHHTGSGTYAAWVVNVGGVTPATSVAFSDITGAVSGNVNLQAALDLKANLASPTFSGSPSLPTGSIGVTQSPGNNTTALATTAFVTAAVPAFATTEQAALNTSATTLISPANYRVASLTTNAWAPTVSLLSTATLGTGASAGSTITALSGLLRGPSALTVGYASRGFNLIFPSNSVNSGYNFGTTSGHSIKIYGPLASTVTGVKIRAVFGRMNPALPAPAPLAARGYGWEWNMATKVMSIIAHDGTTLTTTAVTWVPVATRAYELTTTSDGAGTISLYVDGTLLGTSSGGPTTTSAAGQVWWQTEIQNEATAASQQEFIFHNPKVYTTNG